jgi:hypothetical protein
VAGRHSGGRIFVKQAADDGSLEMLRRETLVYSEVSGPFLPSFVGFAEAEDRAVLAIEYLADARWPPPYPDDVSPLFVALESVSASAPPSQLPTHGKRSSRWERVAEDPEPLLSLGVCLQEWLDVSLASLVAAEADAEFRGGELVHNDIYSGNVCFLTEEPCSSTGERPCAVRAGSTSLSRSSASESRAASRRRSTFRRSPVSPRL